MSRCESCYKIKEEFEEFEQCVECGTLVCSECIDTSSYGDPICSACLDDNYG